MQGLVKLLKQKNLSIASIESLTAGLFSSKLAEVPGASAVLKGALVTYQTSCKTDVLHVDKELVDTYGVISKEVADAMVVCGHSMFQSDLVVSFSGNAGPDVMDHKAVGQVHMAIYYQNNVYSYEHIFAGDRNHIREQCIEYMCEKIKELIGD